MFSIRPIIIIVFFVLLTGLLFWSSQIHRNSSSPPFERSRTLTIPDRIQQQSRTKFLNILHGEDNNIIYTSTIAGTLSGNGFIARTLPNGSTFDEYFVGFFEGFEAISNSDDEYILLKKYNDKNVQKFRVTRNPVTRDSVDIFRENTSNISETGIRQGYISKLEGGLSYLERLEQGDVVVIFLEYIRDGENVTLVKDDNNNYKAGQIILRM